MSEFVYSTQSPESAAVLSEVFRDGYTYCFNFQVAVKELHHDDLVTFFEGMRVLENFFSRFSLRLSHKNHPAEDNLDVAYRTEHSVFSLRSERGAGLGFIDQDHCLTSLTCQGYADSVEEVKRAEEVFRDAFSEKAITIGRDNKDTISILFWYLFNGEAVSMNKEINPVRWESIRDNYPTINGELDRLMAMDRPWEQGKIIFWHGPTGTGKTYALRSLATEWQPADVDIILQPAEFLYNPANLFELIQKQGVQEPGKKFLVVLEDMPNVTSETARSNQSSAQMMSVLLNMADGIIGQGLPLIFLVTTNHDAADFDSAFTRSGRCLQKLYFDKFTRQQAETWLGDRIEDHDDKESFSLSDLYAIKRKSSPVVQEAHKEPVGFASVASSRFKRKRRNERGPLF